MLGSFGGLPLPKTFVIDRRGRIAKVYFGQLESADIDRLLNGALKPA